VTMPGGQDTRLWTRQGGANRRRRDTTVTSGLQTGAETVWNLPPCRPNRRRPKRWTRVRISSPQARCSMRCSPGPRV
jgi:hypothetical protein